MMGRIEHVTSGQVAHVTSLHALAAFMAQVLRKQTRGEHGTAYAALVQQPYGDPESSVPECADEPTIHSAHSAPPPARRGRKRGPE